MLCFAGRTYAAALFAALVATPAVAQQLYELRDLQGNPAEPTAISADGSTVVGEVWLSLSENHAFRWTAGVGVVPLMTAAVESVAVGVNENGSVIVGNMGTPEHPSTDTTIFRWSDDGGLESIDPFHDGSLAYLVPFGGALDAVGLNFVGVSTYGGFRSDGVSTNIIPNPLTPSYGVTPLCISAEGHYVGGQLNELVNYPCDHPGCHCEMGNGCAGGETRAFIWASSDGTSTPSTLFLSTIYAISGDGSVAVGYGSAFGGSPFGIRWGNGTTAYTMPGSSFVKAMAISADGNTVGGSYVDDAIGRDRAWIAPMNGPPVDLGQYLTAKGLDVTGWTFSFVQAISMDGMVIAGYGSHGGGSSLAGFVADLHKDTDGDGLYDDWETDGIPYLVGGQVRRYVLPDANPLRKDIYVEIDTMLGLAPLQATIDRVVNVFSNATVPTPQGCLPGVSLHAEIDEDYIFNRDYTIHVGWEEFHQDKDINFGTFFERQEGDWTLGRKKAKAKAYRYCLFINGLPGGNLGVAELVSDAPAYGPREGTNDFMIALGHYTPRPGRSLEDMQAVAFMHELGHTLGLYHGGGDARQNLNPNHLSVMNYLWAGSRLFTLPGGNGPAIYLNYADAELPVLDENNLIESLGIGGNLNMQIPIVVRASITESPCGDPPTNHGTCSRTNEQNVPYTCINYVPFSGPVDWNNDRVLSHTPVCADPNGMLFATPGETLISVNEWNLLAYNFRNSSYYSDLDMPADDLPCPTEQIETFLEDLPPPPVLPTCAGTVPSVEAPAPASASGCGQVGAQFSVDFDGAAPFSLQWRWRDAGQNPPVWVDFADGTMPHGTVVAGATGYPLRITHVSRLDFGSSVSIQLSCRVTDACGLTTDSPESTLLADCSPSNDHCANAVLLSDGVTVSGTTNEATQDTVVATCASTGPDVWYLYQPATSGAVHIYTCGSSMDTVLSIYTGACGALTEVACNDDSCGASSSVTVPTVAGQAIFVRVGRFGAGTGDFVVRADSLTPPANDACANAVFLADNIPVNGSNVNATQDVVASCAPSNGDVWYAYRPQTAATVTVSTCESSFDSVLAVFSGDCGALTEVGCNDDSCGLASSLSFAAAVGQTYLIRVSGYSSNTGVFVVRAVGGDGVIPPSCGDLTCDDGNLCTDDSCLSTTGCVHANNAVACDDGNPCTTGDTCAGGACQPGTPLPPPGEAQNLFATDKTQLVWSALGGASSYDVARGYLSQLRFGWSSAGDACFAAIGTNQVTDAAAPLAGGTWYLVRGRNACAPGSYGTQTGGAPRTPTVCP